MNSTKSNHKFCLGIDISKADYHVALLHRESGESIARSKFANNPQGHAKLLDWLAKYTGADLPLHACMEATGSYGESLADHLDGKVAILSVVNPRAIKAHGDSDLRRCKSDPADARLIADYCRSKQPRAWQAPSPAQRKNKAISRCLANLKKDRTRESNRLDLCSDKTVVKAHKAHIKWIEKQIAKLENELLAAVKEDAASARALELIVSIKGIGEKSAAYLIAELPDLTLLKNARQLAAYAGVTPRIFQSGTSGKTRTPMSKAGNRHIRKALFFPAMSAMRFNPICKAFAERLKEKGKPSIVIIGAVMTKLLHLIYGVLKSEKPFNPDILKKAQITP
jgi:transposase